MSDKYYIPDIKEFHIGFECELFLEPLLDLDIDSNAGWQPSIIIEPDLKFIHKEYVTRVKYLDKEDIESLGFELTGKSVCNWYKLDRTVRLFSGHRFVSFIIQHDYQRNELINGEDQFSNIKIYANESGMGEDNPNTLFEGTIKNKSELKDILTKIGL